MGLSCSPAAANSCAASAWSPGLASTCRNRHVCCGVSTKAAPCCFTSPAEQKHQQRVRPCHRARHVPSVKRASNVHGGDRVGETVLHVGRGGKRLKGEKARDGLSRCLLDDPLLDEVLQQDVSARQQQGVRVGLKFRLQGVDSAFFPSNIPQPCPRSRSLNRSRLPASPTSALASP